MRLSSVDQQNMEAHYRVREALAGRPFWNWSAMRTPAWGVRAVATLVLGLSLWQESGLVVVLATVVALPPFLAILYLRAMKLEVTADPSGVRAANWFANHRWSWAEIHSLDYARTTVTRLYKGRVTLRSGRTYFLSAVVGSSTGRIEKDLKPRAFVDQLRVMLDVAHTPSS